MDWQGGCLRATGVIMRIDVEDGWRVCVIGIVCELVLGEFSWRRSGTENFPRNDDPTCPCSGVEVVHLIMVGSSFTWQSCQVNLTTQQMDLNHLRVSCSVVLEGHTVWVEAQMQSSPSKSSKARNSKRLDRMEKLFKEAKIFSNEFEHSFAYARLSGGMTT